MATAQLLLVVQMITQTAQTMSANASSDLPMSMACVNKVCT